MFIPVYGLTRTELLRDFIGGNLIMLEEEYSQYWRTVVHTMLDGLMVVAPDGIILSHRGLRAKETEPINIHSTGEGRQGCRGFSEARLNRSL